MVPKPEAQIPVLRLREQASGWPLEPVKAEHTHTRGGGEKKRWRMLAPVPPKCRKEEQGERVTNLI